MQNKNLINVMLALLCEESNWTHSRNMHFLHLCMSWKSLVVMELSKICRVYLLSYNSCRTQICATWSA